MLRFPRPSTPPDKGLETFSTGETAPYIIRVAAKLAFPCYLHVQSTILGTEYSRESPPAGGNLLDQHLLHNSDWAVIFPQSLKQLVKFLQVLFPVPGLDDNFPGQKPVLNGVM